MFFYGFDTWSFYGKRVIPETMNWKILVDTFPRGLSRRLFAQAVARIAPRATDRCRSRSRRRPRASGLPTARRRARRWILANLADFRRRPLCHMCGVLDRRERARSALASSH